MKHMMIDTLGPDHDATLSAMHSGKPQVARRGILFCLIGTEYGYLHTVSGDWRTWVTYSGARRALLRYRERGSY